MTRAQPSPGHVPHPSSAERGKCPVPAPDLIEKYDLAGPRYTSYPTAVDFTPMDERAAVALMRRRSKEPLALYVHVPFCSRLCFFCACTKIISHSREKMDAYVDALDREIEMRSQPFSSRRPVTHVHFGGGSPSHLAPDQLERIMNGLRRRFVFAPDVEISIEVDPRTTDRDDVEHFAGLGFNRLSLGVQDVDETVQRAVNRVQPFERIRELVESAREQSFGSVSMDLVYGLPHQSLATWERTMTAVLEAAPDRLSVFNYAHLPQRFPAQRLLDGEALPSARAKVEMFAAIAERLSGGDYVHIGLDHFARADDSLARAVAEGTLERDFQGYTSRPAGELVGLGMSAISLHPGGYCQNSVDLAEWHGELRESRLPVTRGVVLDDDDRLRRAVIMEIMCRGEIDATRYARAHGAGFARTFAAELEALTPLEDDELVEVGAHGLRVTPVGRFFLRHIAMVFDARSAARKSPGFSKAL